MIQKFQDRRDAGKQLAARMRLYRSHAGIFVLGLPRGGLVVADEIASALNAPLDVFLVRKLGVPWEKELAMGAMAEGGAFVLNQNIIGALKISQADIKAAMEQGKEELSREELLYRGPRPAPVMEGREIIVVDDGLATGATMEASVKALRKMKAEKIIIAVPVGTEETCEVLGREVDDLVCLLKPEALGAIGYWYEDFTQVSDQEVLNCLAKSRGKFLEDGISERERQYHERKSA